MRYAWLVVLLACSKDKQDKPVVESKTPPPSGKAEHTVTGTLNVGGALTAAVTWKPDLALTCGCATESVWSFDATFSDGADTFVALTVNPAKGLMLSSAKLAAGPVSQDGTAGFRGTCKLDGRNADGVIVVDVDGKLTGKAGDVTAKAHLEIVCRDAL